MHHGTCVTHVVWCMSGSLTRVGGENIPGILGACATRNFTYLSRGPWRGFHSTHKQTGYIHVSDALGWECPMWVASQVKIILVLLSWLGLGLFIQTFRLVITETGRSSGWRPWCSLHTLKLVFNVCSEHQGCHPDNLFLSVNIYWRSAGIARVKTQLVLNVMFGQLYWLNGVFT